VLLWVRSEICSRASARFATVVEGDVFMASQLHTGEAASAARCVSDLQQVRDLLAGPFIPSVFDVLLAPIFIAVLFLLHPAFGFLGVALIVVLGGLSWVNQWVGRDAGRHVQDAQIANIEFSSNLTRNTDAARSMGMIPGMARRWKEHQSIGRNWQAQLAKRTNPIHAVVRFLRTSQIVIVTLVGAVLYIGGYLSAGTAFAALMILNRSVGPIEAVIGGWRGFANARDAFERLEALLSDAATQGARVRLPRPVGRVTADRLSCNGENRKPILRDITFDLDAGKILAVVGSSGAGKSTLLRVLANVLRPNAGSVSLDCHPLHHWDPDQLGHYVGYLPQETELLPGTIAENIQRFYPDRAKDDPELFAAAELAGVEELIRQMPEGYNTVVGPKGFPMSGGQRQRLAFARAVYGRPPLILLDEPYSALDAKGEMHLVQSIRTLAREGSTIILVTHKMNMLSFCDHVLVMHAGFVQAYGPRDAIIQRLPQGQTPLRVVAKS